MASQRRSKLRTVVFASGVTVLGAVLLLLIAEMAVRIRWATQHRDPAYLVMGIVKVRSRTTPQDIVEAPGPAFGTLMPGVQPAAGPSSGRVAPSPVALPTVTGTRQWNPCAQKEIEFRVNSAGGRGPEWPETKSPGTIRLLAIGESSTFGAANSEDRTWPALLEGLLRTTEGLSVEVLNFGIPGQRISGMVEDLPAVLEKYRPDVVVHYGGFNETWEEALVPDFLSFLNYRSMLYTYIYEKIYFLAESSAMRLVPDVESYERDFRRLLAQTRASGAALVVVAQAVSSGATRRQGAQCARGWQDKASLATCLSALMEEPEPGLSRLIRSRTFKTVVLQQVLADVAGQEGVPVVDSRGVVVEGDGLPKLFCDEIHLTDHGNAVLSRSVAAPLARFIRSHVASRPPPG